MIQFLFASYPHFYHSHSLGFRTIKILPPAYPHSIEDPSLPSCHYVFPALFCSLPLITFICHCSKCSSQKMRESSPHFLYQSVLNIFSLNQKTCLNRSFYAATVTHTTHFNPSLKPIPCTADWIYVLRDIRWLSINGTKRSTRQPIHSDGMKLLIVLNAAKVRKYPWECKSDESFLLMHNQYCCLLRWRIQGRKLFLMCD